MPLPLEGIKILDLSRLLPGPFATLLLGDLGADVLKVEDNIQGDYARWREPYLETKNGKKINYTFYCLNRNKKSITLNLKTEKGREIFYKLAKDADVILESFRPGVVNKLKVDYETIKKINPNIIYCSLTGYGQNGSYANMVGHDLNYISVAGLGILTGEYGRNPHPPGIQIADLGTGGMNCVIAILSALIARDKFGIGQYIDVAMQDGIVYWLVRKFAEFLILNKEPQTGGERLTGYLPSYNIYQTKDGKYIALGALEEKFWRNLCQILNCPEYSDEVSPSGPKRDEIINFLKEKFKEKKRDEWFEQMKNYDICISKVNEFKEVLEDEHIKSRNLFIEYNSPKLGPSKMVGFPFKLSETPCQVRFDAPDYGEHNYEILKSLGYSDVEIKNFKSEKII
ncbi:MAG: CaiB/BaiF CoA transferase family protein [Candidatus Hodarchaeota archaeon]